MKTIFLDIDGVMIPNFKESEYQNIDKGCSSILEYIIDNTGANIVISSSWRHNLGKLKILWERADLEWELITGVTPSRTNNGRDGEVRQYIDWNMKDGETYDWVAIDDEYQPMPVTDLMGKLVKTDPKVGLTRKEAELIIYKLNN